MHYPGVVKCLVGGGVRGWEVGVGVVGVVSRAGGAGAFGSGVEVGVLAFECLGLVLMLVVVVVLVSVLVQTHV